MDEVFVPPTMEESSPTDVNQVIAQYLRGNPLYQQAQQDIQAQRDYTQKFPDVANYRPSKLRQLLGFAAGASGSMALHDPRLAAPMVEDYYNQPLMQKIRKYQLGEVPYQERTGLSSDAAKIAGTSATQLFNYLKAQADQANSETNRMNAFTQRYKLRKPTVQSPYQVTVPGQPGVEERQTVSGLDENMQPYLETNTLGPNTRLEDLQKMKNDAAWERAKLAAKTRLHVAAKSSSDADLRKIADLTARAIDSLSASQYQAVMHQMSIDYPNMFLVQQQLDSNGKPTGQTSIGLKQGVDMDAYAKAMNIEMEKYIRSHNTSIEGAVGLLKNKGKNPLITGFKADE